MKKRGYIYKYTFPNGKVYIGETSVSVKERHYQHISGSKDPKRWNLVNWAISYYGEPTLETLETIEVEDHEVAKLKELLKRAKEKWIKACDSTVENGNGFNVQGGGRQVLWYDYLLQEKWYEIYDNEKWDEKLDYLDGILRSIGTKKCITNERLNKEEERIWNGYIFKEYDFGDDSVRKTSFNSFYKRHLAECSDLGDVPYEIAEVIESDKSSEAEKEHAYRVQEKCFFDNTINEAFENHLHRDIAEGIWEKVEKQNPELKKIKEAKEEAKREKNRFRIYRSAYKKK